MNIQQRAITSITPYERNPRRNDSAVGVVAASIKEFGFKVPIIVDDNGIIITGHTMPSKRITMHSKRTMMRCNKNSMIPALILTIHMTT